jgi:muconolactone delta-isomerase
MALPLFEGLSEWAKANQASGKLEQVWSFAGLQGGGGVMNVESLEELDFIMTTFPLAPFSNTEIYPLVEIEPSLDRVRQAIRSMMPPAGG